MADNWIHNFCKMNKINQKFVEDVCMFTELMHKNLKNLWQIVSNKRFVKFWIFLNVFKSNDET